MKWFGWPAAALAVALGMNASAADFTRYRQFANDDVENTVSTVDPAAVPQSVPVPEGTPNVNTAPYAGCNCGNGYGGGGFMGFSWASGCGTGPSCCNRVWDNYCSSKRSWCTRPSCGFGSNCGSAFSPVCGSGCGLFSGWGRSGCTSCAAAPTCASGCTQPGDCYQPSWCGLKKVRGYARNCWTSLCTKVGSDCTTGGCTDGAVITSDIAAPVVDPDNSVIPNRPTPAAKDAPIPMVPPEEPAPRNTKPTNTKQTGKSASRDNSSRRAWGSLPLGY